MCNDRVLVYKLIEHKFELSIEIFDQEIPAIVELTSPDYQNTYPDPHGSNDNRISLTFDIDNDYKVASFSTILVEMGKIVIVEDNFGNGSTYYCEEYSTPENWNYEINSK